MIKKGLVILDIAGKINKDELVALCRQLIKIPSHKEVKGQEGEIAWFIKKTLEKENIDTEFQEVASGRCNVIAKIEGTGTGSSLLFNGHMDTVRPHGMTDPYGAKVKGGRIWGRGAADMKAGLAGMMYTLMVLKRERIKLQGSLILAAVVGEENVSEGTQKLVMDGPLAEMAIVGEPTSLSIVTAHRGIEWLEIKVKGKSAHAGVPERGVNAIVSAAKIIYTLEKKLSFILSKKSHPLLGSPTFYVGKIRGGIRNSVVPELCTIQLDRRTIPGEKTPDVIKEIQEIITEVKKRHAEIDAKVSAIPVGPESEDELKQLEGQNIKVPPHEPMEISPESKIVTVLKEAIRQLTGRKPQIKGMPGWTDAALLTNMAKVPSVVFGPGDILQAHSNEEWVEIEELVQATRVYIYTALRVCGLKRR